MDGEGTITARVAKDERHVHVEVSDTGKGMVPALYKKVFKPGFSTKQRGWGLGLSLAKRIIEEYHSGKIFVKKSKPGEGTTFEIRLRKG
jgi:signal transduction histidine kinase